MIDVLRSIPDDWSVEAWTDYPTRLYAEKGEHKIIVIRDTPEEAWRVLAEEVRAVQ